MVDEPGPKKEGKSAALRLAEEMQRRPVAAAVIGVGAAAAATGAVFGARALARRNGEGKPNAVLANAITATEAAAASKRNDALADPSGAAEAEGHPS
jgi:succinyl-CoA synthetase alpha subunit